MTNYLFTLLESIVRDRSTQLALIGLACFIAFCGAFKQAFLAALRSPIPPQSPEPTIDDGWIKETLQSGTGRDWERSTGCTVERRRNH